MKVEDIPTYRSEFIDDRQQSTIEVLSFIDIINEIERMIDKNE